jgi:hypothetical protein
MIGVPMRYKPTHASVTDEPCNCGYLQRAADDPDHPIIFDERTSEYQFTYQELGLEGRSMLVIYHCPFCGGTAPESKRSLLFAVIPRAEQARLSAMLAPIETIHDALAALGTPTWDDYSTIRRPEQQGKPSSIEYHREIRYENMSDVADIWITERPDGKVYWQLQGKYLGQSGTPEAR